MCQIEGRRITPDHCQQLQKTCEAKDCFGCGSPYRLCAVCLKSLVAFPEIELCYDCLQIALHEGEQPLPNGREKNWCKQCEVRSVRYEEYNLCLCCTVSEYAPATTDSLAVTFSQFESIERRRYMPPTLDDDMYQRAVTYACKERGVTGKGLAAELAISLPLAREVVNLMEDRGVVGPSRGRWPRELLQPSSNGSSFSNSRAIARVVPAASSLSKCVEQETSLSSSDRALINIGLNLLREKLDDLSDRIR